MTTRRFHSQTSAGEKGCSLTLLWTFALSGTGFFLLHASRLEARPGAIAGLLFMFAWTALWWRLIYLQGKPGYRDGDAWVEVDDTGIRVSQWHRGWKGMTQEIVEIPFASLQSITVNDDPSDVVLTMKSGGSCGTSQALRNPVDRQAFIDAVLEHRPDLGPVTA